MAALAVGLWIYLTLRAETYLHSLFNAQGVWGRVRFFGSGFLRYYLPDGLWGYALAMGLYSLYPPQGKRRDVFPAAAAAIVGAAYELAQGCGWIRGTADIVDVLLYL